MVATITYSFILLEKKVYSFLKVPKLPIHEFNCHSSHFSGRGDHHLFHCHNIPTQGPRVLVFIFSSISIDKIPHDSVIFVILLSIGQTNHFLSCFPDVLDQACRRTPSTSKFSNELLTHFSFQALKR